MKQNELIAPQGQVYTNYQEGDQQIIIGTKIVYPGDKVPDGYYLMSEEDALRIKSEIRDRQRAKEQETETESIEG